MVLRFRLLISVMSAWVIQRFQCAWKAVLAADWPSLSTQSNSLGWPPQPIAFHSSCIIQGSTTKRPPRLTPRILPSGSHAETRPGAARRELRRKDENFIPLRFLSASGK